MRLSTPNSLFIRENTGNFQDSGACRGLVSGNSRAEWELRRNSLHKLTGNCFWHNRECIWRIREDIDQPMPFAMPKARAPTRSGWITLNPVLVVLTLIFWLWMWGVAGAILAVPMLAIAKIICDRSRPLMALGHFLER